MSCRRVCRQGHGGDSSVRFGALYPQGWYEARFLLIQKRSVDQKHVLRATSQGLTSLCHGGRAGDGRARVLEDQAEEFRRMGILFDDQNACANDACGCRHTLVQRRRRCRQVGMEREIHREDCAGLSHRFAAVIVPPCATVR